MDQGKFKTIGIAVDNYKLSKFKRELKKNGFKNFEIIELSATESLIRIKISNSKYHKLKKLVQNLNLFFQSGN